MPQLDKQTLVSKQWAKRELPDVRSGTASAMRMLAASQRTDVAAHRFC